MTRCLNPGSQSLHSCPSELLELHCLEQDQRRGPLAATDGMYLLNRSCRLTLLSNGCGYSPGTRQPWCGSLNAGQTRSHVPWFAVQQLPCAEIRQKKRG